MANFYLNELDQSNTISQNVTFAASETGTIGTTDNTLYMTIPLVAYKAWGRFKSNSTVLGIGTQKGVQLISNEADNWCQSGNDVGVTQATTYNVLTAVPTSNTRLLVDINTEFTIGNSVGAFMSELSDNIFGSKVMLDAMTNEKEIILAYKDLMITACTDISANFATRTIIEDSESYATTNIISQDVIYKVWNYLRTGTLIERFSMAYSLSNITPADISTTHTYTVGYQSGTPGSGTGAEVTLTVDANGNVVTVAFVSTTGSSYADGDQLTYTDNDTRTLDGVFTCTINSVQAAMLNGDLMNDITSNVVNTATAVASSTNTYDVTGGSGTGAEVTLTVDITGTYVNAGSVSATGTGYVAGDVLIYTHNVNHKFTCTINAVQAAMLNGDTITGEGIALPLESGDIFHTKITVNSPSGQKNVMDNTFTQFSRTNDLQLEMV